MGEIGGLAAPFLQTHQKKPVHPKFGRKRVMLKNRKSGGTCCVGGPAAVGRLAAGWGDLLRLFRWGDLLRPQNSLLIALAIAN